VTLPSVQKAERPGGIEAFCVLNFLGALITPVLIVGFWADPQTPRWYPPFLSVYVLLSLVALAGIWMMKRNALYLYAAVVLVNQAVHLLIGRWNPLSLLLPLFLLAYGFVNFKRMT
jgi:hypothetical protein